MANTLNHTTSRQTTTTTNVEPEWLQEKLANVNPQCSAEIRSMFRENNGLASLNLAKMWAQGKHAENLRSKPEYKKPKRGDEPVNPIALAAEILGVSDGYVNKMAQLYRAFDTERKKEELLSYRMANGKPLTWGHLEQLLKLYSDEASRARFDEQLRFALNNNLTPDDIDKQIKLWRTVKGEKESRGGGRPTQIPPTFEGRYTRLVQHTDIICKNVPEIYEHPEHNFLETLKEMPQGKVADKAEEYKAMFSKMRENLETLRKFCDAQLQSAFPQALGYIETCVQAQAAAQGHSDAKELELADAVS